MPRPFHILLLLLPLLFVSACGDKNAEGSNVSPTPATDPAANAPNAEAVAEHTQQGEQLEREHFALELDARRAEEEFIVPFWDKLRASKTPLLDLAELPVDAIYAGKMKQETRHPTGVLRRTYTADGPKLPIAEWSRRMQLLNRKGVILNHTDWHQEAFTEIAPGAYQSRVRFNIHAFVPAEDMRTRIKGLLDIDWSCTSPMKPIRIAVYEASIEQRKGKSAFTLALNLPGASATGPRSGTGPLLVKDLDRDGLPEILVGGANKMFRNLGDWKFTPETAVEKLPAGQSVSAGVLADFNLDTFDDLLFVSDGTMYLAVGDDRGRFTQELRTVPMEVPIRYPTVLTAGDIDKDGDLDVFFGQWREISDKMPDPFWNANDGYGNVMLRNDGNGNFTDVTAEVGLARKSKRRTYSASLYDTEGDGDMDLIVVSDFYGVDLYRNNLGKFSDITDSMVDKKHLFGMSHTFGDYDLNGVLDTFTLGMGSSTARRLEAMGAGPATHAEHNRKRMELGHGNRMYLWTPLGYLQPPFINDVVRTGWSWGSTTFDFENDGDPDIYVANGYISGKSTRDYCSHFWCKDIYLSAQAGGAAYTDVLFAAKPELVDMSWDGFQANQLLLNQGGRGFTELGFLLDVGFTFDARKVVSADMDRDGKVDLLVTRSGGTNGVRHENQLAAKPAAVFGLRNEWESDNHWIGFDVTQPGTLVQVTTEDGRKVINQSVTGDSFYSQHPNTLHFGLGKNESVKEAIVQFPDGKSIVIEAPSIDTYHALK